MSKGKSPRQIKADRKAKEAAGVQHFCVNKQNQPKGRGAEIKENGGTKKKNNMFRAMGTDVQARQIQNWAVQQYEINKPEKINQLKRLKRQFERDRKRDKKNKEEKSRISLEAKQKK